MKADMRERVVKLIGDLYAAAKEEGAEAMNLALGYGGKALEAEGRRKKAIAELLALLHPQEVGLQVKGFVHRGPDFDQGFRGWKVYAQKQPGIDVPVILGYIQEEK